MELENNRYAYTTLYTYMKQISEQVRDKCRMEWKWEYEDQAMNRIMLMKYCECKTIVKKWHQELEKTTRREKENITDETRKRYFQRQTDNLWTHSHMWRQEPYKPNSTKSTNQSIFWFLKISFKKQKCNTILNRRWEELKGHTRKRKNHAVFCFVQKAVQIKRKICNRKENLLTNGTSVAWI